MQIDTVVKKEYGFDWGISYKKQQSYPFHAPNGVSRSQDVGGGITVSGTGSLTLTLGVDVGINVYTKGSYESGVRCPKWWALWECEVVFEVHFLIKTTLHASAHFGVDLDGEVSVSGNLFEKNVCCSIVSFLVCFF